LSAKNAIEKMWILQPRLMTPEGYEAMINHQADAEKLQ